MSHLLAGLTHPQKEQLRQSGDDRTGPSQVRTCPSSLHCKPFLREADGVYRYGRVKCSQGAGSGFGIVVWPETDTCRLPPSKPLQHDQKAVPAPVSARGRLNVGSPAVPSHSSKSAVHSVPPAIQHFQSPSDGHNSGSTPNTLFEFQPQAPGSPSKRTADRSLPELGSSEALALVSTTVNS